MVTEGVRNGVIVDAAYWLKIDELRAGGSFTVSAVDPIFGQRVNCGSYATMGAALAYVGRMGGGRSHEYAHAIHLTARGYSTIEYSSMVWESLDRRPAPRASKRATVARSGAEK